MNDTLQLRERIGMRRQALIRMTADLRWLIGQPPGSLRWTDTQRSLAELVHLVWLTRSLTDTRGLPLTRRRLARLAFDVVGMKMPVSLSHIMYMVERRLDTDRSMLSRYIRLSSETDIIQRFIQIKKP